MFLVLTCYIAYCHYVQQMFVCNNAVLSLILKDLLVHVVSLFMLLNWLQQTKNTIPLCIFGVGEFAFYMETNKFS